MQEGLCPMKLWKLLKKKKKNSFSLFERRLISSEDSEVKYIH